MEYQAIDLSNNGLIVAVTSRADFISEQYRKHHNVLTIFHKTQDSFNCGQIPPNTRAILITEGLPSLAYHAIVSHARRQKLLYLSRNNRQACDEVLSHWLKNAPLSSTVKDEQLTSPLVEVNGNPPPEVKAPAGPQAKGTVLEFVKANADLRKSSVEEGRRVFDLARVKGIQTTLSSVTQAITVLKRKKNFGEIPESARPPALTAKLKALAAIDVAIESLSEIREYVRTTEEENVSLRAKLEKITAALG